MSYKTGMYVKEETVNDPGWMDWMMRKCCLAEDKETNIRMWNAYGMVKQAYNEKTDGLYPEATNTILAGERAITCSELTKDPDAIIAAMIYKPVSDGLYNCTLNRVRERLGIVAHLYVEKLIALECTFNLDEYNKTLAEGLPMDLLAAETAVIQCNTEHLLDQYVLKASLSGNRFEIRLDTGLILLESDALSDKISSYHSKMEILHNYVNEDLRARLLLLRTSVIGMCSASHDACVWGHIQ